VLKRLLIVAFVLVAALIAAALFRMGRRESFAPNVKVTFLWLTNTTAQHFDAEFEVLNRSKRSIQVSEPGIRPSERFRYGLDGAGVLGSRLGKVTLRPGESRTFRVRFLPVAPTWRGVVCLNWDTPLRRLHNWLLRQTWSKHLPRRWLSQKTTEYKVPSQWVESAELNLPQATDPRRGAPFPGSWTFPN
jgi:hypothetical protein